MSFSRKQIENKSWPDPNLRPCQMEFNDIYILNQGNISAISTYMTQSGKTKDDVSLITCFAMRILRTDG
jgi:hypothetical protein